VRTPRFKSLAVQSIHQWGIMKALTFERLSYRNLRA
jgi:hypothetical protein